MNKDSMQKLAQSLPLKGIRVVELGQNLAGPYASAVLGSLGADIVKVERPGCGDDARGWGPPFWRGTATTFQAMNHGKRSLAVDLKDPESIAWFKLYLAECDVLIQNLRPGVMDELGLGAEELCQANPRLIYCSLGAFGHMGPMNMKPGYEPIIQAFSGMFSMNGSEDAPGARVGMQVLDLGTGIWAVVGCLAALFQRTTTGKGCVIDTSLLETAMGWMQVLLAGFNASGKQPPRHRSGNPAVVVFQAFDTQDGEILIAAANDRLFAKLCVALDHPEWAADERLKTNALRVEHKPFILPVLQDALITRGTDYWIEKLEAAGVPCAPILDLKQALAQPQIEAIGILQEIPGLDLRIVGLPISFNGERPPIRHRAPEVGEHTEEIYPSKPQATTSVEAPT
ncbi:CaiB/BaiF CoA transferase family protein [Ottowia thiooxydans]|uniref:CaiB/BaiF CoA transferase family protein n=1 Tax=Ottowia thiooxydans TaxID=219182 RepID=UPI00040CF278|nr:CoA transferase [Ottowia thiooxydans]